MEKKERKTIQVETDIINIKNNLWKVNKKKFKYLLTKTYFNQYLIKHHYHETKFNNRTDKNEQLRWGRRTV